MNSPRFYVKANSRITLSGYRKGRNVFERVRVTRYNSTANNGLGKWQNSANRKVSFYQKINGNWRSAATKITRNNGLTAFAKISAPTRRQFRATVTPTPTIWGRTSNTITR